jgi:phosphate starvation-inducible protein PhoH
LKEAHKRVPKKMKESIKKVGGDKDALVQKESQE